MLLVIQDERGQPSALGSGFVVADGVVATNFHVIRNAASGAARLVGSDESLPITGVLASKPEHDLVLLSVRGLRASPLTLDEHTPPVGSTVYAAGNPRGLEGTFSSGIVSGIRQIGDLGLLQITAPISPGSSGGPVLNGEGSVVGIATATFTGGQNLNFAVPASALQASLREQGPPVSLPAAAAAGAEPLGASLQPVVTGVDASRFRWNTSNPFLDAGFSFSIRNQLQTAVRSVVGIAIFYDEEGFPLDYVPFQTGDLIPPGLSTRVNGMADKSVKEMITSKDGFGVEFLPTPRTEVELRVLNFELVN